MKKTTRIYFAPTQFCDEFLLLDKSQEHYLRKVLRLREGDSFVGLDGLGGSWRFALLKKGAAEQMEDFPSVPPLHPKLVMGVALCKGSRFESAIEKLAELGVHSLIPLTTERTERKLPSAQKQERWSEISRSASALAGRSIPMEVMAPQTLREAAQAIETEDLIFCHPDGETMSEVVSSGACSLTLFIGPEGGFSDPEVAMLNILAHKVQLGPLNLRVETAALTAAALAIAAGAESGTQSSHLVQD